MVFENDAFSLDVRAGVVEDMKKFGMQTVIDDKMPADLSDISATLTKVKALKPDLLVVSGHNKGAVTAARQMKELQVEVPMVAMTHRSEEHTSELQSLMRISYAVFCLKKKNIRQQQRSSEQSKHR